MGRRVVAPVGTGVLSGGYGGTAMSSAPFVVASVSAKEPPVCAGALEERFVRAEMPLWRGAGRGENG